MTISITPPNYRSNLTPPLGSLCQRTMKLSAQLKNKQFQKAPKGAQNGPAEFGMSGAKVEERIAVSIHCSDESSLDSWLSKFILEICKQDGKEYLPNTLYSIACCILRHVRNYAPQINFLIKANSMAFARHWTVK